MTFNQFFENELKNNRNLNLTTYNVQMTTLKLLNEFNSNIKFKDIDYEFIESFNNFLLDKDYKTNYISLKHSNLRKIIKSAIRKGLILKNPYEEFKFNWVYCDHIVLSSVELERMWELNLSGQEEHIRDVFLVGAHTTLRVSDYTQIRPESLEGDFLKINVFKGFKRTQSHVIIPIHWMVREILEKYDYDLSKLKIQNLATFIKKIRCVGEMASINDKIIVSEVRGGKRKKDVIKLKYELITSHTARRSAATNMVLAGLDPNMVRMLTGHTTWKGFMNYIRISKKQNAENMAVHKYFCQ